MMAEHRCALVLDGEFRVTQTFVHRHIDHLFGGNIVLVAVGPGDLSRFSKPVCSIYRRSTLPSRIRLAVFLRRHNVQCVLAEFGPFGLRIYRAAALAGIPVFCYFRGVDASSSLRNPKYARGLRKMVPRLAGLIAVSDFLLKKLRAVGVEHPNSHVIPSGVDTRALRPGPKDPDLLLSVGRFVAKKAPQTTLRAFAKAARAAPQLRLEMVGEGPELAACIALAERLGIADQVVFHGSLDQPRVKELLQKAAIYLQHFVTAENGDTEGMPSVIQEAMACGAAIVTTRHAGIPEHLRHDVNALLVEEHDLAAYTSALETMLHDSTARDRMGRAARCYSVQHLDYRPLFAELERQMVKAIEGS